MAHLVAYSWPGNVRELRSPSSSPARRSPLRACRSRRPRTPVTIRHLLTHTAGFGYDFTNKTLFELVAKKQVASMTSGTQDFLKAPLLFDPGTRWEYGISTEWLGRVIEQVSDPAYWATLHFDGRGVSRRVLPLTC